MRPSQILQTATQTTSTYSFLDTVSAHKNTFFPNVLASWPPSALNNDLISQLAHFQASALQHSKQGVTTESESLK
jgi:hypothetical protein